MASTCSDYVSILLSKMSCDIYVKFAFEGSLSLNKQV